MGVAYYPVFEDDDDGDPIDGKALAANEKALDRALASAGLPKLLDFFSASPEDMVDFFDEEEQDDIDTSVAAPEAWFEPDAALAVIRHLLACVTDQPKAFADSDRLIEDLKGFEQQLIDAGNRNTRWHLTMQY